jgi:hypothetical protein
VRSTV